MKALVFAGGRSERFFPFNQLHADKSMLWLPSGKPIIREIVDNLTNENTDFKQEDVIICTSQELLPPIKHEFRDTGVRFNTMNSVGTLPHLLKVRKESPDDSYLIHYADMQTDIRYDRLVSQHRSYINKLGTIVTVKVHSPYGHIYTKLGEVTGFEEKATLPPIWCGVGILNDRALDNVYPSVGDKISDRDIGYHLLPRLAERGELASFNHNGLWVDLGSVQAYRKLF